MNRIQERKQQRQEYLKQKGKAYSIMAIFSTVLGLTIISGLVGIVYLALLILFDPKTASEQQVSSPLSKLIFLAFMALLAFGLYMALCCSVRDGRALRRQIAQLPYIPPVTPDTLPAEELLVRGAEEPKQAQSEVLVRPVMHEQETPSEQLLCVTDDKPKG